MNALVSCCMRYPDVQFPFSEGLSVFSMLTLMSENFRDMHTSCWSVCLSISVFIDGNTIVDVLRLSDDLRRVSA